MIVPDPEQVVTVIQRVQNSVEVVRQLFPGQALEERSP
jgi:hypothetical protein